MYEIIRRRLINKFFQISNKIKKYLSIVIKTIILNDFLDMHLKDTFL